MDRDRDGKSEKSHLIMLSCSRLMSLGFLLRMAGSHGEHVSRTETDQYVRRTTPAPAPKANVKSPRLEAGSPGAEYRASSGLWGWH